MKKREAVKLFGRTQTELAAHLGVTKQCVSNWPDELPEPLSDRIVGAAFRKGVLRSRKQLLVLADGDAN